MALALATFLVGYIFLMYTPAPLRYLASKVPPDEPIKFGEVGGSIHGGPTLESFRLDFPDQDGYVEFTDLAFKYRSFWDFLGGSEIVIKEIRIGGATLDAGSKEPDERADGDPKTKEPESSKRDYRRRRRSDESFPDLIIHKIDIENIKFVRQDFEISRFQVDEFILTEEEFSIGDVRLESTLCGFSFEESSKSPLLPDTRFQKDFSVSVGPSAERGILKAVAVEGTCAVGKPGHVRFDLSMFDGSVQSSIELQEDEKGEISVPAADLDIKHFTPGEYYQGVPMKELTISVDLSDAAKETERVLGKGKFSLGKTSFVIDPSENPAVDDSNLASHLLGRADLGEKQVLSQVKLLGSEPYVRLKLSSTPSADPETLIADVFFHKAPSELTTEEEERVVELLGRYVVGRDVEW